MTTSQWLRLAIIVGLLVLLTTTTGVWGLVMVLGIVVMVFIHELGHFLAAKRAGMKVTEFFIGFGPRIWSFDRGETTYGLKVVPAGAYVKIIGMNNLDPVDPADEARSYRQGSFLHRMQVVLAGVAMNFVAALVLIFVVLAVTGAPHGSITHRADPTKWYIDRIYPGTGAAQAGVRVGDKIVAVAGHKVVRFDDLKPVVRVRQGKTVQVTYLRHGKATTVPVSLHSYTDQYGKTQCCLGISEYLSEWKVRRVNPLRAVPQSFFEFGSITAQSATAMGHFLTPGGVKSYAHQVTNARQDRQAAQSGQSSTVPSSGAGSSGSGSGSQNNGEGRLMGLIDVFHVGTQVADSGVSSLLILFALLNIALGIFNLIPLPPFDGGHAAIAVYERVQERRRHLKGRYFADVSRLMPVAYAVVMVLALIFLSTTYLSIANPVNLR